MESCSYSLLGVRDIIGGTGPVTTSQRLGMMHLTERWEIPVGFVNTDAWARQMQKRWPDCLTTAIWVGNKIITHQWVMAFRCACLSPKKKRPCRNINDPSFRQVSQLELMNTLLALGDTR